MGSGGRSLEPLAVRACRSPRRTAENRSMMKTLGSKLTYANVMSTIAIFLLLGGGAAFAASKLAKNSVSTKQIKNGAVTGIKIKKRTITGTNIDLAKLVRRPRPPLQPVPTPRQPPMRSRRWSPPVWSEPRDNRRFWTAHSNLRDRRTIQIPTGRLLQGSRGYRSPQRRSEGRQRIKPNCRLAIHSASRIPAGKRGHGSVPRVRRKKAHFRILVNETFEGKEFSGDVFTAGESEKAQLLSGITSRAES